MSGFLCHLADFSVFSVSVSVGMLAFFLYSLLLLSEQRNIFCSLKLMFWKNQILQDSVKIGAFTLKWVFIKSH